MFPILLFYEKMKQMAKSQELCNSNKINLTNKQFIFKIIHLPFAKYVNFCDCLIVGSII